MHPEYKTAYRVRNWPAYEKSLRSRGDLSLWFDEAAVGSWNARPSGRRGGQQRYSDLAILTTLTLRSLFHLGLRQAEGFVGSLLRLMDLDLQAPDHTTLSRRNTNLQVPSVPRRRSGPLHLVIDSTGLKILGDGRWHAHKHRRSSRKRRWRKLHLGVLQDGHIGAAAVTESTADDSVVGVDLLAELETPIASFRADGAYDTRPIYAALEKAGTPDVDIAIPPRRTAAASRPGTGTWRQREDAVRRIKEVGRRQWRKESGANQQARAENGMYRYKRVLGDRLRARTMGGQTTEAMIGVRILNRMTELGRPDSVAVRG